MASHSIIPWTPNAGFLFLFPYGAMFNGITWCYTFEASSNRCKKGHYAACQSKHFTAVSEHCTTPRSYSVFIETPPKQSGMAGTDGFSNPGKLSFEPFRVNRRVILPEPWLLAGRKGWAKWGRYTCECTRMKAWAGNSGATNTVFGSEQLLMWRCWLEIPKKNWHILCLLLANVQDGSFQRTASDSELRRKRKISLSLQRLHVGAAVTKHFFRICLMQVKVKVSRLF